jgi:uncharacterized protein (TIGR02391 family)
MATKKTNEPSLHTADLTVVRMSQSLPRLKRRLAELESFSVSDGKEVVRATAKALHQKYEDTLIDVFGPNTIEYERYKMLEFYVYSGALMMGRPHSNRTPAEEVEPYRRGVELGAANLRNIIEIFEEKVVDDGGAPMTSVRALDSLHLHPNIADAVLDLFKGEHYANAIEDACKVLDFLVKMKSKRSDPSGTELMQLVFSPRNPILKFNDQKNDSEKSEQQGMMNLYAGAMLAFRNPRAHGLLIDDPVVAFEVIGFVNFLAKSLDRTERS